ncbi:MAG: PASTA domain-containing protein [Spirochaetales bacterium]|nr:PASTA domain-containing protein [Spirochaetales bacterium]
MRDFLENLWEKVKRLLPNSRYDDKETRYFKNIVLLIIGVLGTMILLGTLIFFISLKGENKTLVPDVTSNETVKVDIITAIMKLQEKQLVPHIQIKHSTTLERGYILEQKENPGSEVRLGRTVHLVVSIGSSIDKIGDYVGKKLSLLNLELQQAFASSDKALLEIKQPIMFVNNEAEYGTILEQKPAPGTMIQENKIIYLELVVSKGPAGMERVLDDFRGKPFSFVMAKLAERNIPFVFTLTNEENKYKGGYVVTQDPPPDQPVPENGVVSLEINEVTKLDKDEVFGIFEYIINKYPTDVDLKIVAKIDDEEEVLLSMKHPGGKISIPYVVRSGTEIILYLFDREVKRQYIVKPE